MTARLVLTHVLSPLHAGTGQGVGIIDLPIAREKATNIPYVPGSSVKGVLRASCEDAATRKKVFGPDTNNASEHAGAAQFSDMSLLLFPVRSLMGTFAWVTSPYVLRRFHRDLADIGATGPGAIPAPASLNTCVVGTGTTLRCGDKIVLEDLDLTPTADAKAEAWARYIGERLFPNTHADAQAWQDALARQICVVHDDVFAFLIDTATEVVARIKLKEGTKTVQTGDLWYEESLPAESILWGILAATAVRLGKDGGIADPAEVCERIATLTKKPVQIGGKASVGRGLCRIEVVAGA